MSEGPDEGLDPNEGVDPFDPSVVGGVQLIVLMRIYDVVMAIYTDIDKEGAKKLYDLHAQGKVLGSEPSLDLSE